MWERVTDYDDRFGTNATSSFAVHADRAAGDVGRIVHGLRPLPGQCGVVIGIAGQPAMLELFDSPTVLAQQFASIVEAAALDAIGREPERTPARRAIRFVAHTEEIALQPDRSAGLGVSLRGASSHASVNALGWLHRTSI